MSKTLDRSWAEESCKGKTKGLFVLHTHLLHKHVMDFTAFQLAPAPLLQGFSCRMQMHAVDLERATRKPGAF